MNDSLVLRRLLLAVSVLLLVSCRNPFGFEPEEPARQDPPAPPVQTRPEDGALILNYAYPQDVTLVWQRVSGARHYQIEVYTSPNPAPENLLRFVDYIYTTQTAVTFYRYGTYWWRVRAYSPNWKWYTDWSAVWSFILPSPAE